MEHGRIGVRRLNRSGESASEFLQQVRVASNSLRYYPEPNGGPMALPSSYLTSTKNLKGIFEAIQGAKAPEKFTTRFLENLDFKSSSDRLVIGVLKSLGFLDDAGRPTSIYFEFLDQTQSEKVLASAIKAAYGDLFQVNKNAHNMSKGDVVNKFKSLSQGQYSESVIEKMAMTFTALCRQADFSQDANLKKDQNVDEENGTKFTDGQNHNDFSESESLENPLRTSERLSLGGLHYNIQIILPESRDPKVYDELFSSLKRHLLT